MAKQLPDRWHDLGEFIREQRNGARLSLRRLAELAGVSNPYLSQIERGLRRPSAEILQQIAKALRISAETLYVQAGILEPTPTDGDLAPHILADEHLSSEQKQALVRIYLSFRHENDAELDPVAPAGRSGSTTAAVLGPDADAASSDEAPSAPPGRRATPARTPRRGGAQSPSQ
jgi:transcriptional regulator with XRE-family HTH domain